MEMQNNARTHRSTPCAGREAFGNQRELVRKRDLASRAGRSPLPTGGRSRPVCPRRRGEVTPPYGCNTGSAKQRADVGIGPYGKERKPHRPPGPAAQSEAFAPWSRGMGGNRGRDHPRRGQQPGTIPQSRLRRDSSCCKAWPPPTKRRWRLGRRSRCPKFFARKRSQNFDRCHSFLLAFSATGGARKRPPLHKGAFGDGGCGLP